MADPDTEALLTALDDVRLVKGSEELFDALLEGHPAQVRATLARFPKHPLHERIVSWITTRGLEPPPAPTREELFAARGIDDVEVWSDDMVRRIQTLEDQVSRAVQARLQAEKLANAYAAVSAMLAIVAILGWLAAVGVIHIEPEAPDLAVPLNTHVAPTGADAAPENR